MRVEGLGMRRSAAPSRALGRMLRPHALHILSLALLLLSLFSSSIEIQDGRDPFYCDWHRWLLRFPTPAPLRLTSMSTRKDTHPIPPTSASSSSRTSWKSSTTKRLSKLLPWSSSSSSGNETRLATTTTTSTSAASASSKPSKQERQRQRATEREATQRQLLARRQESDLRAARLESPEQRARYGHGTPEWASDLLSLADVDVAQTQAKEVVLRGRLHAKRNLSSHLAFVVLRQQLDTLQCVVSERTPQVSLHMVRWIERIPGEYMRACKTDSTKPTHIHHFQPS